MDRTVQVCPAWAEHGRVFLEAIGGGDLPRPVLLEAMVLQELRLRGKPPPPSAKK